MVLVKSWCQRLGEEVRMVLLGGYPLDLHLVSLLLMGEEEFGCYVLGEISLDIALGNLIYNNLVVLIQDGGLRQR
jgi:hypothetical protein